jgi:hypothetical protein
VSTDQVLNLVRGRSRLESLDIKCLEGMSSDPTSGQTDALLIELGRSCPNLTRLNLQGDLRFTDKGLCALLAGCAKLKTLKLSTSSLFHKDLSRVTLNAEGLAGLTAATTNNGLQASVSGYSLNRGNFVAEQEAPKANNKRPLVQVDTPAHITSMPIDVD